MIVFCSCKDKQVKQIQFELSQRQPKTAVINRIHLYDSLRNLTFAHLPLLFSPEELSLNANMGYGSKAVFSINEQGKLHVSKETRNVTTQLPDILQFKIMSLLNKIGTENIRHFEVRTDSVFEAIVSREYAKQFHLDIREWITWSSKAAPVVNSEVIKTRLITENWTYLIWYDKRAEW